MIHCGHVFTLRRTKRVGIKSWKSEMQALRAMEMVCDVSNRRINDKNRVAAKRANKAQKCYIVSSKICSRCSVAESTGKVSKLSNPQ